MITPPIPKNEEIRQQALNELEILDTLSEEEYENITKLAARIIDVPICLISLVDGDRQWFKSKVGLDAHETSRDVSFCAHAINYEDTFVVNNALEDERFHDNPLVTGGPNIRFYAGSLLTTEDGLNIGTLCAIDTKPRELSSEDKQMLQVLAKNVMTLMELRKRNKSLNIQINETLLLNDELKGLLKEKERTISQPIESNKPLEETIIEFDVVKSMALVKNSILAEYNRQNNKLIYQFTSFNITANKDAFELMIYNLLLLSNQFQTGNIIKIDFKMEHDHIGITLKNIYLIQWHNQVKQDNLTIEVLHNSAYMIKATEYAKLLNATIQIDKDLHKGLVINVSLQA